MINSRTAALIAFVSILPGLAACTHSKAVSERVDARLEAEPELPAGTTASEASRNVIATAPQITEKQRTELLSVHSKMAADVSEIRAEMAKLQVVLFKTVLDPGAEDAAIRNIRRRLIDLDRRRTNRILAALDQAQQIIGQNALQRDEPDKHRPLLEALEPWKMM